MNNKRIDQKRKKELQQAYRNRMPQMGVISFRCKATGESFLGISNDIKADFNSNGFKLMQKGHPNKQLQSLWDQYGKEGFEQLVLKELDYEDPQADHTQELEDLRKECLEADDNAQKLWR